MYITVTSLRLRRLSGFFKLSSLALGVLKQMKQEKGFIDYKSTGFGRLHFTLSAWESEADLKRFAKSGAHLDAMKQSKQVAREIGTFTYQADTLPAWPEAKKRVLAEGKILHLK